MRTNNIHVLVGGRRDPRLLVADRNHGESEIAVRAIKRLFPHLEVRPVASLAEAESALTDEKVATVFVASGLDRHTHSQTIRWFVEKASEAVVVALLEPCDDRQRQEALEAGASYSCSKPELLVSQLRREAETRLGSCRSETPGACRPVPLRSVAAFAREGSAYGSRFGLIVVSI